MANIKKINLIPTDKEDVVTDTKGVTHNLNGVKFNLKDLGEKYDLEILLKEIKF